MRKNITITKNLTEHRVNFINEVRKNFASGMYGHMADRFYLNIKMMEKR